MTTEYIENETPLRNNNKSFKAFINEGEKEESSVKVSSRKSSGNSLNIIRLIFNLVFLPWSKNIHHFSRNVSVVWLMSSLLERDFLIFCKQTFFRLGKNMHFFMTDRNTKRKFSLYFIYYRNNNIVF